MHTPGVVVDTGNLFGGDSGVPRSGEEGGDDVQLLSIVEKSLRERD